MIRLVKWALFVASLAWATYSIWGLWLLAKMFPALEPAKHGLSNILAGVQLFAVTLGSAVLTGVLLLVPWPNRQSKGERSTANSGS